MKFKVDENLPDRVAALLREEGHEAETVPGEGLVGAEDDVVAERVRSEERVLLTLDLDFADIRTYPPADYHGIIVLRPGRQDIVSIMLLTRQVLAMLIDEELKERLWIVEQDRVRIAGGPG
jgi:predicted nuclease of predicted toxin-antitoxin system